MGTPRKQLPQTIVDGRVKLAPAILAALMSVPGAHNDDREVARAVSLSDKLARAIVTQPVES